MKINKRIAVFLGHPAHFHLYKNAVNNLLAEGYEVIYLIKRKDILEDLVKQTNVPYVVVREHVRKNNSKLGQALSLLAMDWHVFKYLVSYQPKLLIGTYCPLFSYITGIPFISCNEDDAMVVPNFAKLSYPQAKVILLPIVCHGGKWEKEATKYPSYHELAYLHPNHFTPKREMVEKYGIDTSKPYFVMRFASLNAHHDSGIKGINREIAARLIEILKPHGQIYITSERLLEPEFEPYRIKINPLDMHHVMAFASLYIGDSQTMAAEAGVLGTPFVRYNDFVGRIGYLDELEEPQTKQYVDYLHLDHHYNLGVGIRASEEGSKERLYATVERMVALTPEERTRIYGERREKMLSEKIDYAKFLTWFIENYPSSAKEAKGRSADDVFWKQFK